MRVPPRWTITRDPDAPAEAPGDLPPLVISAGRGFGDGRHPSTQLCLQALLALAPRGRPFGVLDFGSGSGILSIAAARLGAQADAVDNDPGAMAHARQNLQASGVADQVRLHADLTDARGPFDLVLANILRDVLLDFAEPLASRVVAGGSLVLAGLVSTDVPALSARYAALLGGHRPEVYEREVWRALVWRSAFVRSSSSVRSTG